MKKRVFAALTAAAILTSSLVLSAGATASKPKAKADSGTAYFSIVHTAGTNQQAAGIAKDKVLGNLATTYQIAIGSQNGTVTVTAKKVTLYSGTGSLSGTATATVTFSGTSETITGGKLKLTKGTGSLKGHSLNATFTGTADTSKNMY